MGHYNEAYDDVWDKRHVDALETERRNYVKQLEQELKRLHTVEDAAKFYFGESRVKEAVAQYKVEITG